MRPQPNQQYFERDPLLRSQPVSSFHALEQPTPLKQSINAVFFSFKSENAQFHVRTCGILNDLYF